MRQVVVVSGGGQVAAAGIRRYLVGVFCAACGPPRRRPPMTAILGQKGPKRPQTALNLKHCGQNGKNYVRSVLIPKREAKKAISCLDGAQPVLVHHLETPELGIAKRSTVGAGSRWLVHAHLPPSLIHTTAAMTLCMDSHPAIHANTRV